MLIKALLARWLALRSSSSFGVNSLRVPVFGPLNNQRHGPSGNCGE